MLHTACSTGRWEHEAVQLQHAGMQWQVLNCKARKLHVLICPNTMP